MVASALTYQQAASLTTHQMVWRAKLRSGETVWEQPGLSSDALPADQVVSIGYVPVKCSAPTIECMVDLAKGERFVRYWTHVWKPHGQGTQQLYVLGVRAADGRHAMLAYYPMWNKMVLAASRPFTPPWTPDPFRLLPENAQIQGGVGSRFVGWTHHGFGGLVELANQNRLVFRSLYR